MAVSFLFVLKKEGESMKHHLVMIVEGNPCIRDLLLRYFNLKTNGTIQVLVACTIEEAKSLFIDNSEKISHLVIDSSFGGALFSETPLVPLTEIVRDHGFAGKFTGDIFLISLVDEHNRIIQTIIPKCRILPFDPAFLKFKTIQHIIRLVCL
jgi:hypothetical protein